MTPLRLYNTRTRQKELFEPLEDGHVRMYTCGPTVYGHAHLGNMRAYVFADLLKRTLRYFGFEVTQVMNITDVGHLTDDADDGEDKMERAARERGESAWDIAERYTEIFRKDLERLHVEPPDIWCKATDHIPEQIEMIQTLEAKGFTYTTSDGVYFDTAKDPHYGELARTSLDAQQSDERIARASEKRNPADFALWKFSGDKKRQMEWDSPWGTGFPGWHVECSAMSIKYLGERFDIHTGGIDHIPVHHPNEIAQSEAALGVRPWVRTWMHGGWMMFNHQKMSKSRGGTVTLDAMCDSGVEPEAFRFFLLNAHYRQQINFSEDAITSARAGYQRLARHLTEADDTRTGADLEPFRERFREALADDMNAPRAVAVLWEVARSDALGGAEKADLLAEFDGVLGLGLGAASRALPESDARIDGLIAARERARAERDFARADAIRDGLAEEGILLEDKPSGTRWRRA